LNEEGLLRPVDDETILNDDVRIIPMPGETPGHQIVRVASGGQTLHCVGDLYHHPLEVEAPSCRVEWADATTTTASRAWLVEAAVSEEALLIATHIAGFGRLQPTASGVAWKAV
jgi:glyoxylase-like metal-dependent hydrolase (beta-lactamase superfamily II)